MNVEESSKASGTSRIEPFSEIAVACPLCNTPSPHRMIKTKLYSEGPKDIDLRPTKLAWTDKEFAKYHPRLYFMQHCPNCHFTAGHAVFAEPMKECSMRLAKFQSTLTQMRATDFLVNKVINFLGSDIDLNRFGMIQALKLHLLAIFHLQLFPEFAQKDAMNLARYCLRLAWLYRDVQELVKKMGQPATKVTELLSALKEDWPEAPDSEVAALKMAAAYYCTTLERSHVVKTGFDEVQLFLLVTRIHLQLGNSKEARRFFGLSREKLRKFAAEVGKAGHATPAGKGTPEAVEAAKVQLEIKKLKNQMEEVERVFDDIRDSQ